MKVVYLAEVKWQHVPQRHHQFARRFPPGWQTLFVESFTLGQANHFLSRQDGSVTHVTVPGFKFPQPWLKRLLAVGIVRTAINAAMAAWLWLLASATGHAGPSVIVVSNIYWARVLQWLWPAAPVVYDLCDQHLAFPHTPSWAQGYFRSLCERASRIVISSQSLVGLVPAPLHHKVVFIGNGATVAEFGAAAARNPAAPGSPILLYLGTLYEWFDVELMRAVALAHPDKRIVLVGPVARAMRQPVNARLRLPNIACAGRVPQEEAQRWVAAASVCLIPFVKNTLTRAINPNKLYEYLAAGKPVVSTDFSPEVIAQGEVIWLARDPTQFVAMIDLALAEGGAGVERRQAAAREHDWQSKADQFVQVLRGLGR